EDLVLTGTFAIDGTGNDEDNLLVGNSNANKLDGGLGADTMQGGGGDDTYMVDNIKDVVDEKGGNTLNDTVAFQMANPADDQATADRFGPQLIGGVWTSKLIAGVEHYDFSKLSVAVSFAGDAASNAITGTGGQDSLVGNGGNDTLDGGALGDTMVGG